MQDKNEKTALMYAKERNNTEAIELLQKKSEIKPDAEIDNAENNNVKPTLYASLFALTARIVEALKRKIRK